ncbi:MAG TPA: hypothetical protein VMT97_17445 [Terriglobales bacterium]|nr:hypothetical protein [Terriglobales bacterium]
MTPAQLGKLIVDENPYTSGTVTIEDVVEVQVELGTWPFKGTPHYIEKAIRVSYTYTDASLHTVRDYILIGLEGGGAY